MGLLDRFRRWRAGRRCKKHGHEWGLPVARPGRSGWRAQSVCERCGLTKSEAAARKLRRRGFVTRSPDWKADRAKHRSAFKGIYTTDQRLGMARRTERRLRAIDRALIEALKRREAAR